MRIFLSYGHDANEDLVRRIKADLEERGHDVWFDRSEIKAGLDSPNGRFPKASKAAMACCRSFPSIPCGIRVFVWMRSASRSE